MIKCPKCDGVITSVKLKPLEARQEGTSIRWHAVAYSCPTCNSVLSVQMDPLALKADTVKEVRQILRSRS